MKYVRTLGLAIVIAAALTASIVGDASATGLEVKGVVKNEAIQITEKLVVGTTTKIQRTDGTFANTCTEHHWVWDTTPPFHFTARIFGDITTDDFTKCTTEAVKVDKAGTISVEWIKGTTNGTVTMAESEVTVPSPFGALNCKTGTGTDIGTLTGVSSGSATMDVKAVTNCGILAPSATWEGSYQITSPEGLGVVE